MSTFFASVKELKVLSKSTNLEFWRDSGSVRLYDTAGRYVSLYVSAVRFQISPTFTFMFKSRFTFTFRLKYTFTSKLIWFSLPQFDLMTQRGGMSHFTSLQSDFSNIYIYIKFTLWFIFTFTWFFLIQFDLMTQRGGMSHFSSMQSDFRFLQHLHLC